MSNIEELNVAFDTSSEVTLEGGEGIKVKAFIANDCGVTGDPEYDWTYLGTVSGSGEADLPHLETDTQKLTIQEGDLTPGESHIFRCTITLEPLSGYENLIITVPHSDLIPRLNAEDQDISAGSDFLLDASQSEDPDGHILYFLWSCQLQETSCLNAQGEPLVSTTTPLTTEQTFSLSSADLNPDNELVFTVTISTDDGREATKTVTLTVKDAGD